MVSAVDPVAAALCRRFCPNPSSLRLARRQSDATTALLLQVASTTNLALGQ
jgi:hypothetical protein